MKVEITIKNYRCFSENYPARITLRQGFTAFIGVNNSGKSSLLRFFYEFRSLFANLSSGSSLVSAIRGNYNPLEFPREVLDPQEIFSNSNNHDLQIELKFASSDAENNQAESDCVPAKLVIRITRNNSTTVKLYLNNQVLTLKGTDNLAFNGADLVLNDDIVTDLRYITDVFQNLSKTVYIGPFRNIISVLPVLDIGSMRSIDQSPLNYFDIKIGRSFVQQWRLLKTGPDTKQNRVTIQLTKDIARIFGFDSLEINSSIDDQTIKLFINEKPYSLSELGAGIAQFIVVIVNVAVQEPAYILIDEPELNLHPSLQLDFLTTLGTYASQGILFATHSIGLARASAEQVYVVHKDTNHSKVIAYEKNANERNQSLIELLGELSFSTYREFGFSKVLLVEGPTEIKTMQQFLRMYKKDHEILLLPLGGRSLINPEFRMELEEIKRISEDIFVLIDSEKESSESPLESIRQDFIKMCEEIGIVAHVLERRATENYFTDRAIKEVKGSKFRALAPYESLKNTPNGWDKTDNWRIAKEINSSELEATDLGTFIKKVCGLV